MPDPQIYTVEIDGIQYDLEGDHPPSEAEARAAIQQQPPGPSAPSWMQGAEGISAPPDWLDRATNLLPDAMGMAGGIGGGFFGGGWGAIPGAAFFGGVGELAKQGIRRLRGPGPQGPRTVAGSKMELAKDVALSAGEQGAYEATGQLMTYPLRGFARALARKTTQPSISERLAPRAETIIDTQLEEGVNPFSVRSLRKIQPTIDELNTRTEGAVGLSTASGAKASPVTVAKRLTKQAERYAGSGADPADRAAVAEVKKGFLRDQLRPAQISVPQNVSTGILDRGGNPIMKQVQVPKTIKKLQLMSAEDLLKARRSTGASAGSKSFGITRGAGTDARKELYHELGTELGNMVPEVRPWMAREHRLLDLKDAAEAAHNRYANASPYSLRRLLPYGGAATTLGTTGDPIQAVKNAGIITMFTNPRLASRLALMAYQASKHPRFLAGGARGAGGLFRLAADDTEQFDYGIPQPR